MQPKPVDTSDGCKYVGQSGISNHAVYTLIQCTPLLVEKAGVTPGMTFRITARKSAGETSTLDLEPDEEGHTKSKTGAISGSTNLALVQQKPRTSHIKADIPGKQTGPVVFDFAAKQSLVKCIKIDL